MIVKLGTKAAERLIPKLLEIISKEIEYMAKIQSFDDPRFNSMRYKVKMLSKQLTYYTKQGLTLPAFIEKEIRILREQLNEMIESGGSDK